MAKKDITPEEQEDLDFFAVLSTESGRNVITWMLEQTGYFNDTANHDPEKMAFDTLRRSAGVSLYNRCVEADHDKVLQLLKERYDNG